MVAYNIQFGHGITLNHGILAGVEFTISPSDISNASGQGSQAPTGVSSSGFTVASNAYLYDYLEFTASDSLVTKINEAYHLTGQNVDQPSTWYAEWTSGPAGLVRFGISTGTGSGNALNQVNLIPIDSTATNWQTDVNSPAKAGTYQFPAVLKPYTPYTQIGGSSDWC